MQQLSGREKPKWTGGYLWVLLIQISACRSESSVCPPMFCARKQSRCWPWISLPEFEHSPCNHWPIFPHNNPGYESNWSFPHQDPREAAGNTRHTSLGAWVHHAESQQIEPELSSEVNWNQNFGNCEVAQLIICDSSLSSAFFASTPEKCPGRKGSFPHTGVHPCPKRSVVSLHHVGTLENTNTHSQRSYRWCFGDERACHITSIPP